MPQTETVNNRVGAFVIGWDPADEPTVHAAAGVALYTAIIATLPEEIVQPLAHAFIAARAAALPEGDREVISLALALLSIDRPCYYGQAARLAANFNGDAFHQWRAVNVDPILRAREETAAGGTPAKKFRGVFTALVGAWQRLCRRPGAA